MVLQYQVNLPKNLRRCSLCGGPAYLKTSPQVPDCMLLSGEGTVTTAPELVAWALYTSWYCRRAASRRCCTWDGKRTSKVGPWSEGCTSLGSPESVVDSEDRSSVDMASCRLEKERDMGSEHYIPGTQGAVPERACGTISPAHAQLCHYFSDVVWLAALLLHACRYVPRAILITEHP